MSLFPVTIQITSDIRRYSPVFQTSVETKQGWKKTLLMAHSRAVVNCCCPGDADKRLSVRHYTKTDIFYLAKFPDTGHFHFFDCDYYSPDPASSGAGGYQRGVIEELKDGGVKIKLKLGLQRRDAEPSERKPTPKSETTKSSGKSAMTLLGLLHFLWTSAGFNQWVPRMEGKRHLGVISYHLYQAAASVKAGRVRLSQAILIAASGTGSSQEKANAKNTAQAVDKSLRLVAIAPLAKHQDGYEVDDFSRLPIMGFLGFPLLVIEPELWLDIRTRYAAEMIAWRQGERVIAIIQSDVPTQNTKGQYLSMVTDAALMRVTNDWIPVDSGYEAVVANALIEEKRSFEKPLRFDSENDSVFPDFWLRDVGQAAMPMEVFGMDTPEYLLRKAEKQTYYDEKFGTEGWWAWNAATNEAIPELPVKK